MLHGSRICATNKPKAKKWLLMGVNFERGLTCHVPNFGLPRIIYWEWRGLSFKFKNTPEALGRGGREGGGLDFEGFIVSDLLSRL